MILRRALDDFAQAWMDGWVAHRPAFDSTADSEKARAYLTSRWNQAAFVDSVVVGPKTFYVRLRGRYAPITCVVHERSSAPSCDNSKP
ncbi:MAG: hypothetical protein ABJE10_20660 [bacterium]